METATAATTTPTFPSYIHYPLPQPAIDPSWFFRPSPASSKPSDGGFTGAQSMELLLLQLLAQLQLQRECSAALDELTSEKRRFDAVEEDLEERNYELRREKRQMQNLISELQFENRQLKKAHCNSTGALDPTTEFLKQRVKDLELSLKKERETSAQLRQDRDQAHRHFTEIEAKLIMCESQLAVKCTALPQPPAQSECDKPQPCEGDGCAETIKERFTEFLKYLQNEEMVVNLSIPPRNWRFLHIAAAYGEYPEVLLGTLLEQGAEINAVERDGETALLLAAKKGKTRAVKFLLAKNANYQLRNLAGNTALHEAAWRGHLDVVEALLAIAGPEYAEANNFGNLPLHMATWKGHADIVKALLNAGADPNAAGEEGQTALHLAAKRGYMDVLRILVEAGGDVNVLSEDRKSALDLALDNNHAEIVHYLKGVIETIDNQDGLDVRGELSK